MCIKNKMEPVFICSAIEWGTNEPPKLTEIKSCAPKKWEEIRFLIEQHFHLHLIKPKSTNVGIRLEGRLVTDFEISYDVASTFFPCICDSDLIQGGSVIIISRIPAHTHQLHYVPLGCVARWREWMVLQNALRRYKKQSFLVESDFNVASSENGNSDCSSFK